MNNYLPSTLDAQQNYWGTVNHASISGMVSANVDFDPWCTDDTHANCTLTAPITDTYVDDGYVGLPDGSQVDWPYTGCTPCGTHYVGYDAFDNIQDGINAVSGSTVNVAAGVYTAVDRALAIIDKPLTLVGAGESDDGSGTVLDGGAYGAGTDTTGLGNAWPRAIVVQDHDVTIRNMRIREYQGDQVTVGGYAIAARASSAWGVPTSTIDNLLVEDVTFEDCYYGVRSENHNGATIQRTTFGADDGATGYAQYVSYSDGTTVRANVVNNGSIWVTAATNAVIGGPAPADGNVLTDATYNGIWLGQQFAPGTSSEGVIRNNTVDGAAEGGIVVWNYGGETADGIEIRDNTVSGAAGGWDEHGGISIYQGVFTNLVISGNDSTNNTDDQPGLLLSSNTLTSATITNNVFANNPGAGVRIASLTWGTAAISNNAITGNTTGMTVTGSSGLPVDASGNWWGTSTPAGVAAEVGADVDYTPWLGGGTNLNPGFDGDFSTLWVDDTSPQSGSMGYIEEALGLVTASTINVAAGTYPTSVTIGTSVDIVGAGAASTFLTGGIVIEDTFAGLLLEAMTLSGDGPGPKNAVIDSRPTTDPGVSDITIRDCVLDGESAAGREAFYGHFITGTWTWDGNEIKNFPIWYVIDNTGSTFDVPYKIDSVVFTDNHIHDCGGSIAFRGKIDEPMDLAIVSGNTFEDYLPSVDSQVWAAIEVNNVADLRVFGNTITGVPEVQWGGEGQPLQIWSATPWTVDVYNNNFSNNFQGIWIWTLLEAALWSGPDTPLYVPTGSIHHNTIAGNTEFGLWISDIPAGSPTSSGIGGPLDAEDNYWGDASGPEDLVGTNEADNPPCYDPSDMVNADGAGNGAGENVDYCPWLGGAGSLLLEVDTGCLSDDQIVVELWMRDLTQNVSGFEGYIQYDSGVLSYNGGASSYTAVPFPLHIFPMAQPDDGALELDGSVSGGGAGTNMDSLLATLVFDVVSECATTSAWFEVGGPWPSVLSHQGVPLPTILVNTPDFKLDDTPPTFTLPADTLVECDGAGNTVAYDAFLNGASANDNCDGALTATAQVVSDVVVCGSAKVVTVEWTATDSCGNFATSATRTFTIDDTTGPIITPPANQTVECDGSENTAAFNTWKASATAVDTCDGLGYATTAVEVSAVPGCAGSTMVYTYEWTATDACSNGTTSGTATFTIVDTLLPTISGCPGNIEVNADAGVCTAVVTWTEPTADDVCCLDTFISTHYPLDTFPFGTTTVTYTATDCCGLQSFCSFDVTVNAVNDVTAVVVLQGVNTGAAGVPDPLTRCIKFIAKNGTTCATEEHEEVMTFTGFPATATATFTVDCDNWTELCAKDEQHSLYDSVSLNVVGVEYEGAADLVLLHGDTDNDSDVDIHDVTWLMYQYGNTQAYGDCPWDGTRDADFSNNNLVSGEDYVILSGNWHEYTTCECLPPSPMNGSGPYSLAETSVPVTELPPDVADRVDLNSDGIVDYADVEAFETRYRLPATLSSKIAATAGALPPAKGKAFERR